MNDLLKVPFTFRHLLPAFVFCSLLMGASCPQQTDARKAAPTPLAQPGKVAVAISEAESSAAASLVALDKKYIALQAEYDALKQRSAVAAAQVGSVGIAITNQPPSPVREVVQRETQLALTNLPSADLKEALEAERRRTAVLTGDVVLTKQLYATAQTEAERMKSEAVALRAETDKARQEAEVQKQKAAQAQAALVEAEKRQAVELKANEAANQAKLDAANKKADEAVQKAYEERQNLLVRILIGIGTGCILAGIGLAIATSGASVVRSTVAAGCGLICFGLAKLLAHPHFNLVFGISCTLMVAGVGVYLWRERSLVRQFRDNLVQKAETEAKLLLANKTLQHVVKAVEDVRAADPAADKALTEQLDYHTSPDDTRPEYVRLKMEHT